MATHADDMRVNLTLLLVVLLVTGCGSPALTPPPPAPPSAPTVTPTPLPIDSPSSAPADPFQGALVVTVSDRLRVRSAPGVNDASIKYEPLLPIGTELRVIGGPVSASGYIWYDVMPVSFLLADGIDHGWVAMADHGGEPWIALADQPIVGLEVAMSAVARAAADPADGRTVATSVTTFGLDLYREMLAEPDLALRDKNIVFSPTSIAFALGMVRAGARNETGSQIDAVLNTKNREELEAGLNALEQALASRDGSYLDDEGKPHELTLRIANASFLQRGWSIEPPYLDAIASVFGAGLRLVDYIADPEAARMIINAWVSQRTAKRIPELLLPPNVSSDTRLYLVNAIYLKANWLKAFPKSETAPRSFIRLDGSTVEVPTMRLHGGQEVPYVRGDGWQATELRYQGPDRSTPLAMTLIVPDDLTSFESGLNAGRLGQISSALAAERTRLNESIEYLGGDPDCGTYPYSLDLFMPRFELETRAELGIALVSLGMPLAFDEDLADFTGIHVPESANDTISIGNVIHQANIDVDELGTEAAAATAIGMDTTGGCAGPAPGEVKTLRLDHPFLFALRDIETGAVLFMGRVVDPAAGE